LDLSSIGAASIDMHLAQTQQSVSVAMLKKAMDTTTAQNEQMIDSLRIRFRRHCPDIFSIPTHNFPPQGRLFCFAAACAAKLPGPT
jgi:hypothetical protein